MPWRYNSLTNASILSTNSDIFQNSSGSTLDKTFLIDTTAIPSASIKLHQLAMMEDRMYALFFHHSYIDLLFLFSILHISFLCQISISSFYIVAYHIGT